MRDNERKDAVIIGGVFLSKISIEGITAVLIRFFDQSKELNFEMEKHVVLRYNELYNVIAE